MRVVGDSPLVVLLPAAAGQLDRVGTHARARRGVHGDAVLRVTASAGGSPAPGTVGEPEAGAAVDAVDGHRGGRAKAAVESAASRAPGVSVLAARGRDRAGRSSMELRHHVHPAPVGLRISDGGPGLVQPLRAGLGTVGHSRRTVLPGRARGGAGDRGGRRFSIPTRARSSPATRSRPCCGRPACRSAWTAAAGRSTTSSSSGSGGR